MPTPYAFDERSVEKLRKLVQSNQLEIANLRRSLQHVAVRGHRDSWKPGGGLEICFAGLLNHNEFITPASTGSSSSDPLLMNFGFVWPTAPSFAEFVDTGDGWVRVKTAGSYLGVLACGVEWPAATGDSQGVTIDLRKRAGIGGSDSTLFSIGATVGRSGFFGSNMGSTYWSLPRVVDLEVDDHLSARAYHSATGHTKTTLAIGHFGLVLMPYNP